MSETLVAVSAGATAPAGPSLEAGIAAAEAALASGETQAALSIWADLRSAYPDDPTAFQRAGVLLRDLGRLAEADAVLSDGSSRFPNDLVILIEHARVADRRHDFAVAADLWGKVRQQYPERAIGYVGQAASWRDARNLAEAEAILRDALERFPDDHSVAVGFAQLAQVQGNWQEAANRWSAVRALLPNDTMGYISGAASLRQAGLSEVADELLGEAIIRFPDDLSISIELGWIAWRRQDWAEAYRRWEHARIRFPERSVGYTCAASALRELGRLEDAAALLLDATRRFPSEPAPAIEYAWIAHRQRDWLAAVQRWKLVRERFPSQPSGYMGAAEALQELRRVDEADAMVTTAVDQCPGDSAVAIGYAAIAQRNQDWHEAVRRWEGMRQRFPAHLAGYTGAAGALRELGRLEDAEAILADAVERFPSELQPALDFADVARWRDDRTAAAARLRSAQDRFPHDARLQAAIAEAESALAGVTGPSGSEAPRYLLFICSGAGLGHLLTALLHSAYYAYRTGRILALDMRRFPYFKSDSHEAFFEHFDLEHPADLRIVRDLAEIEKITRIDDLTYITPERTMALDQQIDNTVVVVPSYTPGEPYTLERKQIDLPFRVVLRGPLREAWNRVVAMPEWAGPVVGLHFRAMVGEIDHRMSRLTVPDFDIRYQALIDTYVHLALSVVKDENYDHPAFFIASDDADFVSQVKERLPNAFSVATHLPRNENWSQQIRNSGYDINVLIDAVIDVWCLSVCDYLIYGSRSGFTQFAMLNSEKLDRRHTHSVHVPVFGEILASLEPSVAADWARAAIRKIEAMRFRFAYLHESAAAAFERAGAAEEAAAARRRGTWYNELVFLPSAAVTSATEPQDIATSRRRIELSPGNPYLHVELSDRLAAHDRLGEAVSSVRRAIEIEPHDAFLLYHLGTLLTRSGAPQEAEHVLRQAIDLEPKVARFYDGLAELFGRQHRWAEAIDAATAAVGLEPTDPEWHARLGEMQLGANHARDAEAALLRAIGLRGNVCRFHLILSIAIERQQRFLDAAAAIRPAIALEPTSATWHLRIGRLLEQAGQIDDADRAYQQAVVLDPDSSEARDRLDAISAIRAAHISAGTTDAPVGPPAKGDPTSLPGDAGADTSPPQRGEPGGPGRLRRMWRRQRK